MGHGWLLALLLVAVGCLADECSVTPVIHVLQYPGCVPKPIPSFACTGRCTSYLQVSNTFFPSSPKRVFAKILY